MRVFRMQHPERIDVIPGTAKYERLNPDVNLKLFTVKSPEICVLTLRLEEGISDPVELKYPVSFFKSWVMRDTALKIKRRKKKKHRKELKKRGRLLERQFCSEIHARHANQEQNGKFKISEALPSQGKTISARDLAHLAAHLAMVHSRSASDGPLPKDFEEMTFYNEFNPRELIVVYNWPLRLDHVDAYFSTALDYIDSCVAGTPDQSFLRHMESQWHLHERRRHWENDKI